MSARCEIDTGRAELALSIRNGFEVCLSYRGERKVIGVAALYVTQVSYPQALLVPTYSSLRLTLTHGRLCEDLG